MEEEADISLNESVDESHSFLDMELEALQSIYINELEVNIDEKCTTVSIDLHPATADKLDEQYVRMTLQFILKEEYPEIIPEIKIRNPRGLSEEKLSCIVKDLIALAENKKGNSMLYEMIDAAKEHLTVGNRPSGECAICLYGFSENDVFTKTECYHYFHSHCLARYSKNFTENSKDVETVAKSKSISNELLCPMCRVPIQFNGTDADYRPPEDSDDNFVLTEEIVELQKKMADLYQKQVEKGGIIDIEAEKNKYLLEISNVPTRVNNEEKPEQKLSAADGDSCATDSQVEPSDEMYSPSNGRKERVRNRYERIDYKERNRNYNRPSENKGNYRQDHRYNRQSYDNYRGNYNKNRYSRQHSAGSRRQFEESDVSRDTNESTEPYDQGESEGLSNTQDVQDDLSETSEQASLDSKSKHNSNFSPRYNRGPRRGGNHYGYHSNNRQFNKPSYHERNSSQTSRRYSSMHGDEQPSANTEETAERDGRTYGDRDRRTYDDRDRRTYDDRDRRTDYRSGNYKRDEDYKQRYPDNRNSQRGYKGAYGRRDNYSHNNYPRNNRYGDSRDRDQYHTDRDKNFRGKRTFREGKYQGSEDNASDGYNKQGARNYTRNRPGRYADRSYNTESSNNESESVELSSQSSDYKTLSVERENGSKRYPELSDRENKSSQVKESASLAEKCPDKMTTNSSAPTLESSGLKSFPSASSEILQVSSRTVNPPPGFANPLKKVIYGLKGANPPPGFNKS